MKTSSQLILAEIGYMRRIMEAACAAEASIGGTAAGPHDSRVQMRAAEMILAGEGARMRTIVEAEGRTAEPSSTT